MDHPFLAEAGRALGDLGLRVGRFEFPYMQRARAEGRRLPPDPQPRLQAAWRQAVAEAGVEGSRLLVAGKSLGGRMAATIADEAGATGLVVLGYPFHPRGKPERTRLQPLMELGTPALVVQGERDPLGSHGEVCGYGLPSHIRLCWAPDGDHDLTPRKRSGRTAADNRELAWAAMAAFAGWLAGDLWRRSCRPSAPSQARP
jgi:hypothetical protein